MRRNFTSAGNISFVEAHPCPGRRDLTKWRWKKTCKRSSVSEVKTSQADGGNSSFPFKLRVLLQAILISHMLTLPTKTTIAVRNPDGLIRNNAARVWRQETIDPSRHVVVMGVAARVYWLRTQAQTASKGTVPKRSHAERRQVGDPLKVNAKIACVTVTRIFPHRPLTSQQWTENQENRQDTHLQNTFWSSCCKKINARCEEHDVAYNYEMPCC